MLCFSSFLASPVSREGGRHQSRRAGRIWTGNDQVVKVRRFAQVSAICPKRRPSLRMAAGTPPSADETTADGHEPATRDSGELDDEANDERDGTEADPFKNMPTTPEINVVSGDQFTEYESRDEEALKLEAKELSSVDEIDAHRYVLTQDESQSVFERAALRHGESLAERGAECGRRFVIAKGIGDPTFGTFRNAKPWPPRYCCFQSFVNREQGWDGIDATTAWLEAVERVMDKNPLAPTQSHVSTWARRFEGDSSRLREALAECGPSGFVVGTELLTSKYNKSDMAGILSLFIQHGEDSLASGNLLAFDVMQSLDSPVVFKSFEVYKSMAALKTHMERADSTFEESVVPHRAAVNRVRQLYSPLVLKL